MGRGSLTGGVADVGLPKNEKFIHTKCFVKRCQEADIFELRDEVHAFLLKQERHTRASSYCH